MEWQLIGVWRWLVVIAVLDFVFAIITAIYLIGSPMSVIPIMFAFASGAATIGAVALWARDRWLKRNGIIRQ